MNIDNFLKIFVFLLFFSMCGCASHQIETNMTKLRQRPQSFPGTRVAQESIRVYQSNVPRNVQVGTAYNPAATISGAMNGTIISPSIVVTEGSQKDATLMYNLFAERRLYDALLAISDRFVCASVHSEWEIDPIEVIGKYPDQKVAEVVAVRATSFFIPPLANVKTHLECPYKVGYVLRKNGKEVHRGLITGVIRGKYKGWYVAGAIEGKKLTEDLNNAAEQEIAVQILNDVYNFFDEQGGS